MDVSGKAALKIGCVMEFQSMRAVLKRVSGSKRGVCFGGGMSVE